ncbi:BrnT family toxin [Synechococcus elongatus]|uniref:BrnT family toxin n=1 Tax=Synechococcus elongatus TaxID=32046 RepID=UPI003BF84EFA
MRITYDPVKRDKTLLERGLDFESAIAVFAGLTLEVEDTRNDYGEKRVLCVGFLDDRMVMVGYTPRSRTRLFDEEMQCPRNSPLHAILRASLMMICLN